MPTPLLLFILDAFVFPFAIAFFLTAGLIRWAPRLGLIDMPAARKVHVTPTPKGGGLAIILGVVLPLGLAVVLHLVDPHTPSRDYSFVWLAMIVAALGLWDDLRPLPWQLRLGVQGAVAVGAEVWCLPQIPLELKVIGAIWLVAMINSFNMLDNMDALSAGVAWIATAAFCAILCWQEPILTLGPLATTGPYLTLLGALPGFLWFNRSPARIFMGDVGSMFLGFMVGFGAIVVATRQAEWPWTTIAPVCICAVPIYDQLTVVLIRISQGRSPFHADKQHLSHRLVARGWSSRGAVRLIHLLALFSGVAGLFVYMAASWSAAVLVAGIVIVVFAALAVHELVPFVRATKNEAHTATNVANPKASRERQRSPGEPGASATGVNP